MLNSPEERNVAQWQVAYAAGEFDGEDIDTQIDAGWVNWFSPDEELPAKTQAFGKVISKIKEGGKTDLENQYVFFMENATEQGIFPDFRIATIEGGNVELKLTMDEPDERFDKAEWKGKKWHVYGGPNRQFRKPIKAFKTDSTLLRWLNAAW